MRSRTQAPRLIRPEATHAECDCPHHSLAVRMRPIRSTCEWKGRFVWHLQSHRLIHFLHERIQIVAFCELVNGLGAVPIRLEIIKAETGELIFSSSPRKLEFKDRLTIMQLAYAIQLVTFDSAGVYFVQLWCNRGTRRRCSYRLRVSETAMPAQPIPAPAFRQRLWRLGAVRVHRCRHSPSAWDSGTSGRFEYSTKRTDT